MLVLHYTGMESCDAALERLCDPSAEVSAHYLIDEDGTTYQLVPDEKRAWHAGISFWRGETDINSASIGIELVNPGHDLGYRPFDEAQISTLISLCRTLIARHQILPAGIVGHSDIAPGRKTDPGELFPWRGLAEAGIGIWPDLSTDAGPHHGSPWDQLAAIGYPHPSNTGCGGNLLNAETAEKDVLTAFQSRFTPENVSGVLDDDTTAVIAATARAFS